MDKTEFKIRREELMDIMGKGSIAILSAAPMQIRSHDVHYPYRQDSNFYYLTGFPEPDALAVFIPEREQGQYIIFCRENDPYEEINRSLYNFNENLDNVVLEPVADSYDLILPEVLQTGVQNFFNTLATESAL